MKNKKFKYIILFFFTLFILLGGCQKEDEFLNVLPKGVVIAKTSADFRKLLDACHYSYNHSLCMTTTMLDVLTDDVHMDSTYWSKWTSTRMHFQELFTFKDNVWIYENLSDDLNWNEPYYVAGLMCAVLEEIDKVTDNIELKNQLIAEAKVHRAYAYLTLVNTYAKHYDPATASTDLAVPIVTQPASLPSLERNSVQEVYNFILDDLLGAIDDLPDDVDQYKHRPTKTAVYAILARIYLYMEDYENALLYANQSLQIHNTLYDYNTQYDGDYPYYSNVVKISRTTDEEMLLFKSRGKYIHSYDYMYIDTTNFNQIFPGYSRDGADYINYDLRRTLWFYGWNSSCTTKSSSYNYKFRYYWGYRSYRYGLDGLGGYMIEPTVSISTPEVYLIRAECNARLGNLQAALDDINTIGEKRYKLDTYEELTLAGVGGQEAVLDAVLKERRRELYGKDLRLFDIKRLHLPMTHYLGSIKITVPADDPRFILPIFPGYIEMNPEIEQNDRSISGVTYE